MADKTMWADEKQLSGADVDISSLIGTWVNTKPDTDHIAKIVVTERDGALLIQPYGSGVTELVDWGQTRATPYAVSGGTEAAGFHARYRIGTVATELAANQKLGILVIQSYTSFHDGDRLSHYSREFFHRSTTGTVATNGQVGADSLVGDWVNSNPATAWLTGFTLADDGGQLVLRARGANVPTAWGEVKVTSYQDNIGEPAFHAVYDLGSLEAVLAANANKGVVIIAAFLRFKDGDVANFLCREFFFRQR